MNWLALIAHNFPFLVAVIGGTGFAAASVGFYLWLDHMEALV